MYRKFSLQDKLNPLNNLAFEVGDTQKRIKYNFPTHTPLNHRFWRPVVNSINI